MLIRLGDKEVEFNSDFKFYITTKLSNPHYTPEISTKTAIVNFAVKEQGHFLASGTRICQYKYVASDWKFAHHFLSKKMLAL